MEAIADDISAGSPTTAAYAQNFLHKSSKLLDRATLVTMWEDVDKAVCTDTRVQATVQVHEGKQRRCWRYLATVKSPGLVATGTACTSLHSSAGKDL
jgi:hypothetical protein